MPPSPNDDTSHNAVSSHRPTESPEAAERAENQPPDELSPLLPGTSPTASTPPSPPPPRSLTFINGLAIVIGIQVGSGIFSSPSTILKDIASPASVVPVWVAAGVLAWTGASCFIELGSRVPRNGGIQEYLRYIYDDAYACIATWTLIFIVKPCSIAMICLVFAEYMLNLSASDGAPANVWLIKAIALAALIVMSLLNSFGTRLSARIANLFLALKFLGLGSIVVTGLAVGLAKNMDASKGLGMHQGESERYDMASKVSHALMSTRMSVNIGTYTDAILAAMWAYSGWEALGYVGGEVENPRKTIPRVLNSAMIIVISLYVLANVAYLTVLPPHLLRDTNTIALDFGKQVFGRPGELYFDWIVTLSCLGALDVKVFTLGRLTLAAIDRRYLPDFAITQRQLGHRSTAQSIPSQSPDYQQVVPFWLYIFNIGLATIYIVVGSFRHLLTFVGMADNSILWVAVFGVLVLRCRQQSGILEDQSSVYRTHLINPLVFCAASGFVIIRSALGHPVQGFILLCFFGGSVVAANLLSKRTVA